MEAKLICKRSGGFEIRISLSDADIAKVMRGKHRRSPVRLKADVRQYTLDEFIESDQPETVAA